VSQPAVVPHRRGRPRKFDRPSRAVTVTLPEDVLGRLTGVDGDLGRAIVALVERRGSPIRALPSAAELASYGTHAVIVVTPVKALRKIPGVQLVPVGNGRHLISLSRAQSIPQLELSLRDAIERRDLHAAERAALTQIAEILRHTRQSPAVQLEERTIIVLEAKRQRRHAPAPAPAPAKRAKPAPARRRSR
jgi:hypothetical protein